ncbi:hypothetical protein FIBSPDRAFT_165011 [Athelia psychrophila]|uniref:Uncharacterized protein n=1 Tax=Athelia psychrophila TaxID=1759441 RepID=A0A166B753_9AGAM|nr:hypothetical protein FIBSPDRAFT_165011 [Fibularhizoctonia sp. CBS 109695]
MTATTSLLDLRVQEHLGGDLSFPARTSASSAAHVSIFRDPSPALATSSCLRPSSPRLSKMYPLVRGPPSLFYCALRQALVPARRAWPFSRAYPCAPAAFSASPQYTQH